MYKNNYLVDVPDFKEGLYRVLDIGSTVNKKKFKIPKDEIVVDNRALLFDWKIVGEDIRRAIDEFECAGCGRSERR